MEWVKKRLAGLLTQHPARWVGPKTKRPTVVGHSFYEDSLQNSTGLSRRNAKKSRLEMRLKPRNEGG